ncbi:hypothetical protein C0584_04580 [Candidatus Parcubacteria bacterium]|nr:MAG: hypothetical protein C0584_04580 [Candidatus Parcubacteria bacterium]
MDFRLVDQIRDWMTKEKLMKDADVVSLAGAAKNLVDGNEEAKNVLLKQIEISSSLHNCLKVYLVHHSTCGAYAVSYNFASLEEEKKKQSEDLDKAVEVIKEKFPNLEVSKIWVEMKDGEGKEVEIIEL